jgi:hypothetical protein
VRVRSAYIGSPLPKTLGEERVAWKDGAMEPAVGERGHARDRVLEHAEALGAALMNPYAPDRWEPLRDLLLAGFEAGGLSYAADGEAFRTAVGELAGVALDARRHRGP